MIRVGYMLLTRGFTGGSQIKVICESLSKISAATNIGIVASLEDIILHYLRIFCIVGTIAPIRKIIVVHSKILIILSPQDMEAAHRVLSPLSYGF